MKAILIDDESLALDFLESQINKVSDITIVHKFVEFKLSRDAKLLEEIDIVFLDVEMPGMNGIQLAERLLEIKPTLIIVFVTAFHDYAVQAFELDSLDYLVKPVQLNRLEKTIDRIKKMTNYYQEIQTSKEKNLRINVCKELSFEVKKGNPEVFQWRTTKAQELFLYLLLHTGKTVRKSELMELLWPEAKSDQDYSQLYTAIYNVRKTLNNFSEYFSLKSIREGYHLTINNVYIDVVEWENAIDSAPPINADSIHKYEEIMEIYTGSYLQAYDYAWAQAERHRLEILWLKTAHQLADFYFRYNYLENAEIWYSKIYEKSPDSEKAIFSLMKIYDRLGYGLLVDHQYNQYQDLLKRIGLQVDPHIQKWYEQWIQNKKK